MSIIIQTPERIIQTPERGSDAWGSGAYGARRGNRKHCGIDYAALPGSIVLASVGGKVTKYGWVYSLIHPVKKAYRYIKIKSHDGYVMRYMYVKKHTQLIVGEYINKGDILGTVQDLEVLYPNITPHVHFDVKLNGQYIDPAIYLKSLKNI